MSSRTYHYRRRVKEDMAEGGQDSFLDIVSNIVGILIILVMIAGVQVGAIHSPHETKAAVTEATPKVELPALPEPSEPGTQPETQPETQSNATRAQMVEYIELAQRIEKTKAKVENTRKETQENDTQYRLVKQRADGATAEHDAMLDRITQAEAAIELQSRKKSEDDKKTFDVRRADFDLTREIQTLESKRDSLAAAKPKPKLLENVPTPITQKVEGHEDYFCLRKGRVAHVPINVCKERLQTIFRRFNDVRQTRVEQTIGPFERYSFHFQASVHQARHADGIGYMIRFDYGEFIPQDDQVGETLEQAMAEGSMFKKTMSINLRETSTITLFVYPDSFNELREIKQYLLDRHYTIALRPMPTEQNITISPNGTSSTTY